MIGDSAPAWGGVNIVLIWGSDTLTKKEEAHVGRLLDYGLGVVVAVRGSEEALRLEQALARQNLWVVDVSNRKGIERLLRWLGEPIPEGISGLTLTHHWGRHEICLFLSPQIPQPVGFEGCWLEFNCSEEGPPLLYRKN